MTNEFGAEAVRTWKATATIPIGLGGSVFGWIVGSERADAILDRFFEIGGRFIDTSDGYSYAARTSAADSESMIGSWVRRRGIENEIRIMTKVGLCPGVEGLAPAVVAEAVDASLDRLGISVAEAILAHADDGVTAPEEIAAGFAALVGARTHHIGVSRFSTDRLRATRAALRRSSNAEFTVIQEEFSLAERGGVEHLVGSEVGQRLGLVCSAALARGFLTGKFEHALTRVGARHAYVDRHYGLPGHHTLLAGLRAVAAAHGVAPAAVAIRWLLQHEAVALPLVSVTDPGQLDVFQEVTDLRLTPDEWESLDTLSAALPTGPR
ncbi:aldo/keto reductase [Nocardia caishijiensis]|uniref:Aryl-alcohol dehydrogenase-like predicted oxidoreductase n=1 Tax=Nocardia caishijiensis TaxID=184756 RepID=A0ABQ6YHJ6_9NOCA|nr:aldo/keto reductase [Nocardia caishijiensis]KAF0845262.1 aryl-alcohol dehydrogenase-like predicted oxidoreductase [Nocardia caishijiensis]